MPTQILAQNMDTDVLPLRPSHIRIGVVRASRRINGSRGATGTNLCGADVTDRDVVYREAKRIVEANCAVWPVCQECRSLWLKAKAGVITRNDATGGAR